MFGRHDDVIKQDQKRDADVALPDDAFAVLTASTDDATNTSAPIVQQTTSSAPIPVPTIDGISNGPTNNLASPYDLMMAHQRAIQKPTETTAADTESTDTADDQPFIPEPQRDESQETIHTSPGVIEEENSLQNDDTPPASTVQDNPEPANQAALDLTEIKHSALKQLSPLMGQLDLTPEDKFRAAMMLIQESDETDLIPVAYEAAQAITDDRERAEALLEVVNEINYFTKKASDSQEPQAA